MECHSIIRFPEIQELILFHLDAVERKEAGLVCKGFYATICRLERGISLVFDYQTVMDDKIFESIMQSDRRLGEIVLDGCYSELYNGAADRLIAVVEKFKNYLKTLQVYNFSKWSDHKLLNVASEMERFRLFVNSNLPCVLQKQFTKLKHLSITDKQVMTAVLDKIPNDSLEVLSIQTYCRDNLIRGGIETFVNRQKKLKTLELPRYFRISFDHLVLEQLEIYVRDDKELAGILKKQPALKRLRASCVGQLSFEELRKMPNIEFLETEFAGDVVGELKTLKKLGIYESWSVLCQLVFPNLQELMIDSEIGPPTPEQCQALQRNSPNLKHIEGSSSYVDFLPAFIEYFPSLKTLYLDFLHVYGLDENDFEYTNVNLLAPSGENLSLEELIIQDLEWCGPMETICDTINDCPNLKRIQLTVTLTKHQVLSLIENHPHLTHFWYKGSEYREIENLFDENDIESGNLDPILEQIINIFKNSPAFVSLTFSRILDFRVEDFLDANRIVVTRKKKHYWNESYRELKFVKKSYSRDPFKNFHERRMGDFSGFFFDDHHLSNQQNEAE